MISDRQREQVLQMARHTIQVPIEKSASSPENFTESEVFFKVNPAGEKLYMQRYRYLGTIYERTIGLAWSIPAEIAKKKIVETKLNIYSLSKFNHILQYKMEEFIEGAPLPGALTSSDGSHVGGILPGWNSIRFTQNLLNGSVIIGQSDYTNFQVAELAQFYSHRSATNKPYIVITYDDIPPELPSSLYPSQTTLNPRDVIRFSWLHNSKEFLQQKGFELQYSTNGGSSWTTVNHTTTNQYYDMPANTLPTTGTVMWRVRTIDGNDEVSGFETTAFTLGIVPQKAPIPISPISQYLDENKPIRFEWSFVGGSGSEYQSKFDLQYSTNGGSTWTTKTATSEDTFYELPANTFSGGNITWRVRTYNNWNEVSPCSENRSFTVIGSPSLPLISNVSNSGRPTATWQSTNQHIYELQILKDNQVIFDTGAIPSTSDRSFKLPIYLKDGNYLVKLRIFNEYNLYSTWAEKSFTISTVKPQKPIIEVFGNEYSVAIKTSNTSAKTLVYRDNICIGEVVGDTFIDFTGENKKEYQYYIRTVDANDNFNDSDIKLAKCKFTGNTLALAELPGDFLKLKYGLDSIPKKTNTISNSGNLVYYDGREYPVAEYSEFRSKSKTVTFTLKTKEELNKLIELISSGRALLFRDTDEENIYGSIFDLDYSKNILGYYEVGFTITKTDYKGVAYD